MKKATTKLLKPSIPTSTLLIEGCQFEIYDKEKGVMSVCGNPCHNIGKIKYEVCPEHYDYLIALGKKPKVLKVKK
jgi:hypothetical protein